MILAVLLFVLFFILFDKELSQVCYKSIAIRVLSRIQNIEIYEKRIKYVRRQINIRVIRLQTKITRITTPIPEIRKRKTQLSAPISGFYSETFPIISDFYRSNTACVSFVKNGLALCDRSIWQANQLLPTKKSLYARNNQLPTAAVCEIHQAHYRFPLIKTQRNCAHEKERCYTRAHTHRRLPTYTTTRNNNKKMWKILNEWMNEWNSNGKAFRVSEREHCMPPYDSAPAHTSFPHHTRIYGRDINWNDKLFVHIDNNSYGILHWRLPEKCRTKKKHCTIY